MPANGQFPRMYLKVGGADAQVAVMEDVISIEVDSSLTLPDMFSIHLRDPQKRWVDDKTFSLGGGVEILAKNGGEEMKVIVGEITAVEPVFSPHGGPTVMVRGFDKSHRLNRGRKTASFVQMKDGDIVKKIAQNAGLKSKVDPTRQVHEYVLQDNKTDWEFLISRAQRIGYRVLVREDTLHFAEAPQVNGETPTITWDQDLVEFNGRLTTSLQVSEVRVQGWDPDKQQQIVGKASRSRDVPKIGERRQGGQAAEDAFGLTTKEIVVNRPVTTQGEADDLAQSICDEIGQGFIQAECVCYGNPAVQAGATVKLEELGDRFSGTYRVTHALHRYDASSYMTEFTVGGRHATTIGELLSAKSGRGGSHSPTLGVVTNNDDPKGLGRVKVKIPSLKDGEESAWARLVVPGGGKKRGFQWLPEVGDEVLVLFEHEDIHRPLVVGGLWSDKNPSPEPSKSCLGSKGEVNDHRLVSRTGMKLVIGDDSKDQAIAILNPGDDIYVKVSETDSLVEISSKGDVKIRTDGEVSIQSKGKLAIKGSEVEIKSDGKLALQGAQTQIKSNANMDIEAGAMMKTQAGAIFTIKGALVQIN